MSVSVVLPVYNERENLEPLYRELREVLVSLGRPFEILFIDDGSQDGSTDVLRRLAASDETVRVIRFRRNFGQTAALDAGLHHASGEVIVLMDADAQNDPSDIPRMMARLDEGYDLVHGWRKERQDPFWNRRLPSLVANWLISRSTGFPIHDLGCTLKVLRRDIADDLQLYGEMHRFIPILAQWRGARCVEMVTKHHPRRHGVSKYGISRTLRVLLDLITVKYLIQYLTSPMKLFGLFGLGCGALGLAAGGVLIALKLGQGIDMTGNPLLILSVSSMLAGLQFLVLGMLGELGVRGYYESQGKKPYTIRERINFPPAEPAPAPQLHRAA